MPFFRFVARSTMARSEPDLAICSIRGENHLSNWRWRPDPTRLWTVPLAWQKATDYGKRSLVETTMGRYKALIGPRLRARGCAAQQTEAAIGVVVLKQML